MGKNLILMALAALAISYPACLCAEEYVPSAEVRKSQAEFSSDRFGIFIHWGIYSMFARGEWYLNNGPLHSEYSKHARAILVIKRRNFMNMIIFINLLPMCNYSTNIRVFHKNLHTFF